MEKLDADVDEYLRKADAAAPKPWKWRLATSETYGIEAEFLDDINGRTVIGLQDDYQGYPECGEHLIMEIETQNSDYLLAACNDSPRLLRALMNRNRELEQMYLEAQTDPTPDAPGEFADQSIETYYARQIGWSSDTFGAGKRTKGIVQHIGKELEEVLAKPDDLSEWIDIIVLAMDGFWRHGGTVNGFLPALLAKQQKNMARTWPAPTSEDVAIEHDRAGEPAHYEAGND